jgi:hypothetical protein
MFVNGTQYSMDRMAFPASADQRSKTTIDVEQFLRDRISAAKGALQTATAQMERSSSRRARNQYSEAFYHYCQALHQASLYATQGVKPPEFAAVNGSGS